MGLPGSGKSYFASRFAEKIGAEYLASDLIRKEIFKDLSYSAQEKLAVYSEMENRMRAAIREGKTVVVDATFHREVLRNQFEATIVEEKAQPVWIWVRANEDLTRQRVSKPRKHSDADWAVFLKLKAALEPLTKPHLELSSDDENVNRMITEAKEYVNSINCN